MIPEKNTPANTPAASDDLLQDPAWLRAMLWLLVKQLGGSVDVNLIPAFSLADQSPADDLGAIRFEYAADGLTCRVFVDDKKLVLLS